MAIALDDILTSHRTRRPVVMGILNVTPDSFSDGGEFTEPSVAIEQARAMMQQGADIIDIGAESTRPGSDRVPAERQIDRLGEILPAVCEMDVRVSIDTTLAPVADFALQTGADIVNDVSAGRDDPDIFALCAERAAPIVLMHMLGQPKTMQQDIRYENVVDDVRRFLDERLTAARREGIDRERCIVDPGIGFGKHLQHNLTLLRETGRLLELGQPVLIGASRKRFIGTLTGQTDPAERLGGTLAAHLLAWQRGATIFRVHDVRPLVDALRVAGAIDNQRPTS
ncbi:MAG: dihydropteroate synthase [Phycisphaerae bacterium]